MTKAHVEIGQIAARELPEWQILYIPAPDRFLTSWKAMEKNDILSGEQRLNLLRKAVEPHGFLCEDCEVHLKTSAKTYDTMQYLRTQYGQDTQLVYVCGTDKLSELSIWYKAEGIFGLSRFLVIPRDGDEPEKTKTQKIAADHSAACVDGADSARGAASVAVYPRACAQSGGQCRVECHHRGCQ